MKEFLEKASVPVVFKPNAGLPRVENGETVFDVTVDEFAEELRSRKSSLGVLVFSCPRIAEIRDYP